MSADAAATNSANPLGLMGDSETVLNVMGHMENNASQNQNNMSHLGVSGVDSSMKRSRRCRKFTSLIILCVTIVTAGVIMTFPLIFFYTKSSETTSDATNNNKTFCTPQEYTGSVCLRELQQWLHCSELGVFIPSDIDQETQEREAQQLITALQLLNPSEHCMMAFRPFICLYLFGLCEESGHVVQPSYQDCIALRDVICAEEVKTATVLLGSDQLPECDSFSKDNTSCNGGNQQLHNEMNGSGGSAEMLDTACSEEFYFDNNSQLCRPECGVWTQFTPSRGRVVAGFRLLASSLGILSSLIVLALSCAQYKRMFRFPTILILFKTVSVLVYSTFHLIGWVWRKELLCSSKDLLSALDTRNATPMCKLLGGMFAYLLGQIEVLWLFHTAIMMCGILWPMKYQYYNMKYGKFIRAGVLLLGVAIPAIPPISANWLAGYGLAFMSHYDCTVWNKKWVFYAFLMPVDIVLIAGVIMLIIILWNIASSKCLEPKNFIRRKASVVEIKIVIIICYYLFVAVYTLSVAVVTIHEIDSFTAELTNYYLCEVSGTGGCSKKQFNQFDSGSKVFAHILIGTYPAIFLIYIVQFKTCTRKIKQRCKKYF